MSRTYYSYYRGGDLAGVGARAAGFTDMGGVEYDPQIASVADRNFPDAPSVVADVRQVDPALLLPSAPTWAHFSPVCTRASVANQPGEDEDGNAVRESEEDKDGGRAVARFIAHWRPRFVSVENVWGYRNFDAFGIILQALREAGYSFDYWHLNAADYGVPQTRKRLILMARRGELQYVQRPNPTHRQGGDMFHEPWVGWYEAIEDLIPTLPASQFAPWQLDRLPAYVYDSMFFNQNESDDGRGGTYGVTGRGTGDPATTIKAAVNAGWYKAFLMNGTSDAGVQGSHEPAQTVVATVHGKAAVPRAWLMTEDSKMTTVSADQPAQTVVSAGRSARVRALLVSGDNASREITLRNDDAPCWTVQSSMAKAPARALLVHSTDQRSMPTREGDEPAFTVMAQSFKDSHAPGGRPRAWLEQGRVVAMTPRALARFQSLPDWYWLPEKKSLACKVIGNGVPCGLMEAIGKAWE